MMMKMVWVVWGLTHFLFLQNSPEDVFEDDIYFDLPFFATWLVGFIFLIEV